jgi:hypothetical protein
MAERMIDKRPKGADATGSGGGFDVVLVPHGSVDQEMVVGRISAADVPTVSPSRIRSAKRFLRKLKDSPLQMRFHRELFWSISSSDAYVEVQGRTESHEYENSVEQEAHQLLGKLSQSIEKLGDVRSAFRAELLAAIEEGDQLLKKAAR